MDSSALPQNDEDIFFFSVRKDKRLDCCFFKQTDFSLFSEPKYVPYRSYFFFAMSKQFRSGIIFAQALLATLWSLYYSYFGDPVTNLQTGNLFSLMNWLTPCDLCRYARILMSPLVIISFFWLKEKSTKYVSYILPFSIMGIFLETYHYLLQKVNISTSFTCTFANPCNALEVNYLWFITLPLLCLTAFVIITIAALHLRKN